MTRFHRLLPAFSVALACAFGPLATSERQESAVALKEIADPGAAPPFDAAVYEPYFKRGSATLIVPFTIARRDGTMNGCEPHVSDGVLYPSTPYVRWALQKWAFLKQTNWYKSLVTTRPDAESGFAMPDYLVKPFATPSAVRYGECDETHHVTFRHLPAGSYIFWGIVDSRIAGSGYETHEKTTYDPITGVVDTKSIDVSMNNSTVVDNYYLFSDIVTLTDSQTAEMRQSSIHAFAYQR